MELSKTKSFINFIVISFIYWSKRAFRRTASSLAPLIKFMLQAVKMDTMAVTASNHAVTTVKLELPVKLLTFVNKMIEHIAFWCSNYLFQFIRDCDWLRQRVNIHHASRLYFEEIYHNNSECHGPPWIFSLAFSQIVRKVSAALKDPVNRQIDTPPPPHLNVAHNMNQCQCPVYHCHFFLVMFPLPYMSHQLAGCMGVCKGPCDQASGTCTIGQSIFAQRIGNYRCIVISYLETELLLIFTTNLFSLLHS